MKICFRITLVLLLCASFSAFALNVQNQKSHFPGSRGATIIESQPRSPRTLALGFGFNYALKPLELGNSAGGVRVQGLVDHLFSFDFGTAYGISDRIMVGLNIPMHITHNVLSLTNFNQETVVSFGDIQLTGLYNILRREDSSVGFGLSVAPFATFPSGSNGNFVGDANVTGGFLVVADADYNSHYVGFNYGFRFRKEENFLGLRVAQEMLYRLAYSHFILESQNINGFAEVGGSIVLNKINSNSSPFEALAGVSKVISERTPLLVKVGAGAGILNGYGTPDLRALLQVSYDYPLPKKPKKEIRPVYMQKVEKRLKELTIFYPTDGAEVDPFYDEKIAGIAEIMIAHPELGPLYIIAHTDDVGDDKYNQELSERRAKQALDSILGQGISQDQIISYGLGEVNPAQPNTGPENRALNRRTIFTFTPAAENTTTPDESATGLEAASPPNSDSYTETLKRKARENKLRSGEYYKEETKIKKVQVGEEEVFIDEEDEVQGPQSETAPKRVKEVDLSSTTQAVEEESLPQKKSPPKSSEEENFEESFDGY